MGQLVGGDREAYTYLPQSVDRFLTPAELVKLMEAVGLRGVTIAGLAWAPSPCTPASPKRTVEYAPRFYAKLKVCVRRHPT